ncbi:MAG: 50S ribosomal protein L25/general stress protein Ctc [Gammaproteobacteria bacterium]|nr:50S ribosomal protein L25/general stress protein Ctc [Gammaproteobacteria bacterium]
MSTSTAFELNVKVRTDLGKGASRRLRRLNDEIPAIIYGGNKEPVAITIAHNEISHAIENEAFFSHIISLNVGKKSEQVIIKALQRHPAKPFIMHADFLRVSADEVIVVKVPVHFLNPDKCIGVKLGGGSILHTLPEIEVSCLPKDLPEYLEVDMLEVDLGESVHISDVVFPENVTSVSLSHGGEGADQAIAIVQAPKAEIEEAGEEAAGEDTEAPAAGEEENPEEDGN